MEWINKINVDGTDYAVGGTRTYYMSSNSLYENGQVNSEVALELKNAIDTIPFSIPGFQLLLTSLSVVSGENEDTETINNNYMAVRSTEENEEIILYYDIIGVIGLPKYSFSYMKLDLGDVKQNGISFSIYENGEESILFEIFFDNNEVVFDKKAKLDELNIKIINLDIIIGY